MVDDINTTQVYTLEGNPQNLDTNYQKTYRIYSSGKDGDTVLVAVGAEAMDGNIYAVVDNDNFNNANISKDFSGDKVIIALNSKGYHLATLGGEFDDNQLSLKCIEFSDGEHEGILGKESIIIGNKGIINPKDLEYLNSFVNKTSEGHSQSVDGKKLENSDVAIYREAAENWWAFQAEEESIAEDPENPVYNQKNRKTNNPTKTKDKGHATAIGDNVVAEIAKNNGVEKGHLREAGVSDECHVDKNGNYLELPIQLKKGQSCNVVGP
jgi:hypothetical protein